MDKDSNVLSILCLVYSFYALIFSLLVCASLLMKHNRKILKTEVSLLMFSMFFSGSFCWLITTICTSISLFTGKNLYKHSSVACDFLGFILLMCEFFKNIVMFCICFFTYMEICQGMKLFKYKSLVFLIIFSISCFVAAIPFIANDGGDVFSDNNDLECWIGENGLTLFIYYVPLLVIFLASLVMLILSLRKFRMQHNMNQKELIKLFIFPMILIISYSVGMCRSFIQEIWDYDIDEIDAFRYMHYILLPMHGIFNSLYYLYLKKSLRTKLKRFLFPRESRDLGAMLIPENQLGNIQNLEQSNESNEDLPDFSDNLTENEE